MAWVPRFWVERAVVVVQAGGVIAYPTEGVFGLGCDPLNPLAVGRLLGLKGRTQSKGLILIAAQIEQLTPYLAAESPVLVARWMAHWDGPLTCVVPAASWVPLWLRGPDRSLAVRITAHPIAAALCTAVGGPLVSTSANRQGRPPARTALRVRRSFTEDEVFLVPGRVGGHPGPSSIVDALTGARLR